MRQKTVWQYNDYYSQFYPVALEEASRGQTTSYEAEQVATDQSHWMTQRIMCQTNLEYLSCAVFGMDTAKVEGRRIWHEPIHGALCDELQGHWDSLIHLSRNMLKSTEAKIWAVQQILADPANVAIGMWSRAAARVEVMLKSIKDMTLNPKLLSLFPDRLIPKKNKWSKSTHNEFTMTRDVPDEEGNVRQVPMDENQIEVWGLDSTVVGRHYTHHYCDDIIDRGNTTTATQIEKAQDQWAAIQAMKSPGTIEKIVGTPWHQLDLYASIEEQGLGYNKIKIAGVDPNWNIIYPFYTKEWLERQASRLGGKDSYLFSCQYFLDTRPRSHRMFVLPVPQWSQEMFPEDPAYFVAVDPSTGKHERTDKTGIAVGAVSRKNPTALFFVEADSYLLKPEEIADAVVERIVKYSPDRVGIEFGLQAALEPLIHLKLDEAKTRGQVRVPVFLDIKTGGGSGALSKSDKLDRLLGAMTRDRRAYFLPSMRRVFEQMATFNPNVQKNEDDILDACSMLIQTVPYFHQSQWGNVEEKASVGGFTIEFFKRKVRGDKGNRIFAA